MAALHRSTPDDPLPRKAQLELERKDSAHPQQNSAEDYRLAGAPVAALLGRHFTRPAAHSRELLHAFHEIHVPIHPNEHIRAAVQRADVRRVRRTGRWLVRNGTDHCAVAVGLALVAETGTEDDIPLMQLIGLLSSPFGALAAHGLERLPGRAGSLLRLAERVDGWGRVSVVRSLCRVDDAAVREWLLRESFDGDFLNAYVVREVAEATRLHEVLSQPHVDPEIIAHTGRMLLTMTECAGAGMTLQDYPHSEAVLTEHLRHLAREQPSVRNYCGAAWLVRGLRGEIDMHSVGPVERWRRHADAYEALLDRDDWCEVARAGRMDGDRGIAWLLEQEWGCRLRAFAGH
ncbi:hypothetical protein H9Y04_38020 [Streptomyces sp. TRM66268-LWL]|uniref:Uncharacterized protein n=1 Tax=Streptomyces polyasparticus TaxID=2767826 RepID=A0ABR7SSB3_9ACTN|nr:hypothetical protein [Streptomyces polyasparticus]MBC9718339.1 hypothetical protein [Streptomyces polyasparticus]